jgi:hypothetical protein
MDYAVVSACINVLIFIIDADIIRLNKADVLSLVEVKQ